MLLNYFIAILLNCIVNLVISVLVRRLFISRTFNLRLKALVIFVAPAIISGLILWAAFYRINPEISRLCALFSFGFLILAPFSSMKFLSHIEKEGNRFRVFYYNNLLQLRSILVPEEDIRKKPDGHTMNVINNEMEYRFLILSPETVEEL